MPSPSAEERGAQSSWGGVQDGAGAGAGLQAEGRTRRLFFSSFLLIQLRACCCGSMQSGKRLARVVRMPF